MGVINKEIFRAYDIRGVYPDEIDEAAVKAVASCLVKEFFKKGTVVIAHDARVSAKPLYRAAIEGAREGGGDDIEIVRVGLATTPMVTFLVNDLDASGGIMVTASHNPKQYNGMKMIKTRGEVVSGEELYKKMQETAK